MDSEFLFTPEGCGPYCHAPSLASTGAGTLLVAWYAYAEEEHIGARLVMARQAAGSARWSTGALALAPASPATGVPHSTGNPVLFQEPSGTIWLFFVLLRGCHWKTAELHGASSEDDGRTWSAPETLWPTRGLMVRHPPTATVDGDLLLPAYDEERRQAVLLKRSAHESIWREAYRLLEPPLLQPVLLRDAPTRLSLFFRPWNDPRRIWRSHSVTEGMHWSTPVRTPLPCPLSGLAAFALPDRICVVHNYTEEHERHPLSLTASRDGGITWSAPWHFEQVEHEVSYPQFHARRDGGGHGVYSYNRRVIKYVRFDRGEIP